MRVPAFPVGFEHAAKTAGAGKRSVRKSPRRMATARRFKADVPS
jgi:hypothetical protein